MLGNHRRVPSSWLISRSTRAASSSKSLRMLSKPRRPLFLGELGFDSQEFGVKGQAEFLSWQLRAVFEKGLCGAAVYSWTDEWSIFASDIKGWSFGLTTENRTPKPALEAVREVFGSNLYSLRKTPWPMVSVVVAV